MSKNIYMIAKIFIIIVSMISANLLAQDSCSDVLSNGTFRTYLYKESSLNKMLLASIVSNYTFSEANTKFTGDLSVTMEGIPLGDAYTAEQYELWRKEVKNSLNVEQISKHALDIMITEGDNTIISAWKECMLNKNNGFLASIKRQDNENYLLKIEWNKNTLQPNKVKLENDVNIRGAEVVTNSQYLKRGTIYKDGVPRLIELKRISNDDPIIVTGQAEELPPFYIYLPTIKSIPPVVTERIIKYRMFNGPHCDWQKAVIKVGEELKYICEKTGDNTHNDTQVAVQVGKDMRVRVKLLRPEDNSQWVSGPWIKYKNDKSLAEDRKLFAECIILDDYVTKP